MLFAWAANAVHAQTYFYLGEIAVTPAAPTEQDQVQLQLIGDLSSTGSSIVSANAEVNGYTVNLTLVTYNTTGLSVIVPHTEVVDVGLLSAGTYTVNIIGFGVDDLAPANQHVFTVSGGAFPCDSLVLASLTWSPFNDTTLLVHIFNPTATLFSYPNFLLLADNGDTLAEEAISSFGIATESYNTLDIPAGTTMPASPFSGTLQLFTSQQLACSWDLPVDLCPTDSCSPMLVQVGNSGGGIALGSFTYAVLVSGIPIASGSLTLTADQQSDQDTLCLQAGNYVLQLLPQQPPTGGQIAFGVSDLSGRPGHSEQLSSAPQNQLNFTFYGPCIDEVQSVVERTDAGLVVSVESGLATLLRSDGKALGDLYVIDAQGRLIATVNEPSHRHQFRTSGWAPGLYLLQARKTDGHVLTVRFIIG